jgi:antitoxin CptB
MSREIYFRLPILTHNSNCRNKKTLHSKLILPYGAMYKHYGDKMDEKHTNLIKCLRIRSWQRGTREMCLLLGSYANNCLQEGDTHFLQLYETLLSYDDHILFYWICQKSQPFPSSLKTLIIQIRNYHGLNTD